MTFKLTTSNYFSDKRPHVSNSMISSYIKDPAFYKLKHIDKALTFTVTDAMKKGSIVDAMLTQPGNNPYRAKFKRTCFKKDDSTQYARETKTLESEKYIKEEHLVSQAVLDSATDIALYIESQPFWKEGLKQAVFQQVLEGELEGLKVCGMTDRIDRTVDQRWRISDLKITSAMKMGSATKWMYNAYDMGYVRQAALYRYLWAELQGVPVDNVDFVHIIGTQVEQGLCKVMLINIPAEAMDAAMLEVRTALKGIKKKKFKSKPVTWGDIM